MRNRIYCMDCMDLMSQLPDGAVSMILTDPPYGISYQNNFTRKRHDLLAGDCGMNYEKFARESYRILSDNSHAYFFTRFDCYSYHYECLKTVGFHIKNCMVIEKGTVGGIGDLQEAMQIILNGLFSARKEGVFLTIRHCSKIKRKKEHNSIEGENRVKNIKRGLMPVGLERNIPKLLITPHGRRKIRYITRRLRMWSFYHGCCRFQACRKN